MTLLTYPYPNIQNGDDEDVEQLMANLAAIRTILNGEIRNDNIHGSAAIAYAKLNLVASIVNADIKSDAAIAYSKLALAASIVDADIASAADIAGSKLLDASVDAEDKLLPGNNGEILKTAGGAPEWHAAGSDGALLYQDGGSDVAWTAAPTAGQILRFILGVPTWVNLAFCRVKNSSATVGVVNDTPTLIAFNAEDADSFGFHDNSVNNTRLTVPSGLGGTYAIFGHVTYAATTSEISVNRLSILLNGGFIAQNHMSKVATSAGRNHGTAIHTIYTLAAGDYVELQAYQVSGGNRDILGNVDYSPVFGLYRID